MEFQTELKKELNQTKLRLSLSGVYTEDYQIRMIRENTIKGLIPLMAHGEEERTVYEYDITGLISLRQQYKQKKITREEMQGFLKQVQEVLEETKEYLLNPNRLLLNPDYIFYEEGICKFCYFPNGEEDIRLSFHRLMDDFVQWTDYQDIPSVKAAFYLHKETMKENYSLKKLEQGLEEVGKEEVEGKSGEGNPKRKADRNNAKNSRKNGENRHGRRAEEERETRDLSRVRERRYMPEEARNWREELWGQEMYDNGEHDWISRQELGGKILRETDNLWNPVKRFLHRHKRPKWGDWDGVYIDEEEL